MISGDGSDDTIEHRRGEKIKAKGIYRDPVRSGHSHFVKASGLRWLSLMLLVPIPWARRVWALPFLTVLVPSECYLPSSNRSSVRFVRVSSSAVTSTSSSVCRSDTNDQFPTAADNCATNSTTAEALDRTSRATGLWDHDVFLWRPAVRSAPRKTDALALSRNVWRSRAKSGRAPTARLSESVFR